MVEKSVIVQNIWSNPQIQARTEAILREYFWQTDEEEVRQPIPLSDVMWCVAANPTIQSFVRDAMAANEANPNDTTRAIIQIPDEHLAYVVLNEAWTRLRPKTAEEEGEEAQREE